MNINWNNFANLNEQSLALAQQVAKDIQFFLTNKKQVTLCVPGGNTPSLFLTALSQINLDWPKVTVLLNDERWVPVSNTQSNERMLRKTLQCNRATEVNIIGFHPNNSEQKKSRQQAIEQLNQNSASFLPIDICVLGMGEDGHIASLFPGMESLKAALDKQQPALLLNADPPGKEGRVSLNLSALLSAQKHYLLVTGQTKKSVINEAQQEENQQLPVSYLFANTPVEIYYSD